MGKNRYVGHRYIPIFENGWDKTKTYEPLTFVYYEGKTYVSRQLVPTNIEITDNDFWAFFMDNTPQIFTPTFIGKWEDKQYDPLSIVIDNGNTYVSKQNVPVGTVLTDETYWLDLSTYYIQLFTDYESAEQERQQAEDIRVDNENQRKIDHANRNAELAGKANKQQEDWIEPTLLNGSLNYASAPIRYYKDEFGRVHLEGRVVSASSANLVAFRLPTGYRPSYALEFLPLLGGNPGRISINQDGFVNIYSPSTLWNAFDGISFRIKEG